MMTWLHGTATNTGKFVAASALALTLCFGFAAAAEAAQNDPVFRRVALLDNADVQVIDLRYEAGSVSPLHTHEFPRRVIYVVQGGTLEITPGRKSDDGSLELVPGAKAKRIDITAGQTLWLPAATHMLKNVGKTFIRVVEIEVKKAESSGQ